MKGSSNIISSIHCLSQAKEHFDSFCREHPGSNGARIFANYSQKIEWIYKDIKTINALPESVRQGIKAEWESDPFIVPAIAEKVALLNPSQREISEATIDAMLSGETVEIIDTNQTKT